MSQISNSLQRSQSLCHTQLLFSKSSMQLFFTCLTQLWMKKMSAVLFRSNWLCCLRWWPKPPWVMACLFAVRLKADLPSSEDCHFIHCSLKLLDPLSITFKVWCNRQFCAIKINDCIMWTPDILHKTPIYSYLAKRRKEKNKKWCFGGWILECYSESHQTCKIRLTTPWWIILFKQTYHFMKEADMMAGTVGCYFRLYLHMVEIILLMLNTTVTDPLNSPLMAWIQFQRGIGAVEGH